MSRKLWIALVQHVAVPGTVPALFYQAGMPSDRAIKRRFSTIPPREIEITHVLDLSFAAEHDEANRKAIEAFDDAMTRAYWK